MIAWLLGCAKRVARSAESWVKVIGIRRKEKRRPLTADGERQNGRTIEREERKEVDG
jgi:hypothetical protein